MSERAYSFDAELRIWRTPAHDSMNYSDGEEVERRLLATLKQCRDLTSNSDELRQYIIDWPTEYHFSSARANLLRPFHIDKEMTILELGCGCGAITRYLGESGASVTALEGSLVRASITAARCHDLPNVTVVADTIDLYWTENRFNIVTLIGVLEYAPFFIAGDNPSLQCLSIARSFLTPGGILLLAIENQIGLKYFNGCGEDHIRKLFFGIQDQYAATMPVTFGRAELGKLLGTAGFQITRFLFPFPDYKLPDILLTEQALHMPELGVHNLLAKVRERDYAGRRLKVFDEHLTWRVLGRNGLIGELANSFLVVACGETVASPLLPVEPWLATIYATSRKKTLATATTIYLANTGLRVSKSPLGRTGNSKIRLGALTLEHRIPTDEPFIVGDLLLHCFQRLAAQGELTAFAEPLRQWLDLLFQGCVPASVALEDHLIPGEFVDCIPANLIVADDGRLVIIDKEWQFHERVPLSWVVIRGLISTLHQCIFPYGFGQRSCETVIAELLAQLGYSVQPSTFRDIATLETALQEACRGSKSCASEFYDALASSLPCLAPLEKATEFDGMAAEIDDMAARIAAYEGSMSWRITRPLRYVARILFRRK